MEGGWKDYYYLLRREYDEMRETYGILEIPWFTGEEEALLDKICKSNEYFRDILEEFYKSFYDAVVELKKGDFDYVTGGFYEDMEGLYIDLHYLIRILRKEKIAGVDDIIDKLLKIMGYISAAFGAYITSYLKEEEKMSQ